MQGNRTPTKLVLPNYVFSDWKRCHAINAAGGIDLFGWQDDVLEGWLGKDAYDHWAATTCAGSLARQNGKSLGLVVPRINYGMVYLGEEVLYTSHLQKTSTETFESVATFFDSKPLKKHVKDIKTALGREQVILKNGARIKFLARTRNGGRGQHGDLLIFDEALELDADSQASFLPAISASKNPQVIYISSPPTAQSTGEVFRGIRKRALSGESDKIAWFEWSVEEIGDVKDKTRWYLTNPSLGLLIQESTIESECEQMDADTFARERLGWWDNSASKIERAIKETDWYACATDSPSKAGLVVYAVKFSMDGSTGVLAACHKPENGKPFIYVVEARSLSRGLNWFVETLTQNASKAAQIVIDGQSNAQTLNDRLLDNGVPSQAIIRPRTKDVIAACSTLTNSVKEHELLHYGQPALDASATKTKKRRIGANGGFGFASTDEADATLIEACALALWAAKTTKRKPGRKAVVF